VVPLREFEREGVVTNTRGEGASGLSVREEDELRGLVYQCMELKNAPWYPEALASLLEWWEHLPLTRLCEAQARAASLQRVLRRTDPDIFRVRRTS
jgi:hypothetical protein